MKPAHDAMSRSDAITPKERSPIVSDVNSDSQSIVINAPATEAYHRCLHFEDLPRFITSMTHVDRIDDPRFSCTSNVNGKIISTEVTIMLRVPDRRIAWQAVSDEFRVGVVFFDPLLDDRTKVTVKIRSIIEPVLLTGALRNYLNNFKRLMETTDASMTSPAPGCYCDTAKGSSIELLG
jgi:uncharacterized membrane protein